jgi:hypothetical protein
MHLSEGRVKLAMSPIAIAARLIEYWEKGKRVGWHLLSGVDGHSLGLKICSGGLAEPAWLMKLVTCF